MKGSVSNQNKTALVIGNGAYKNNFSALDNPVPEARQMATALESIGFEVIRAYNVQNQEQFYRQLKEFEEKVKTRGGIALFHYGGHGVQVNGRNYLLPTEINIPDEERALLRGMNVSEVTATIKASSPDTSVIILDACRNNPFDRGGRRGLAEMSPPLNSLVVYAADAGESAQDGLFTPTLLKYLTTRGWNFSQVLQRTRADVLLASKGKQSPGEYSQLLTDIYLAGHAGAVSTPEASSPPPKKPPFPSFTLIPTYGALSVSARTAGELYLNGTSMGRIPAGSKAALNTIPVGTHQLEMRYGGLQTERKSVTVQEGHALSVSFAYEEIEGYVFIEGGRFTMGSRKVAQQESPRNENSVDREYNFSYHSTINVAVLKRAVAAVVCVE